MTPDADRSGAVAEAASALVAPAGPTDSDKRTDSDAGIRTVPFLGIAFTPMSVQAAATHVAARGRADRPFCYIVTPNSDTVVKYHGSGTPIDPALVRESYDRAWLRTVDSKIIALLGRLVGLRLPVCTGADLTAALLEQGVYSADDPITILGGDDDLIAALAGQYGLTNIHHYNPPFGFWKDPVDVGKAVEAICARPSGLVLFAVGNPQQELVALEVLKRGGAFGVGICVGASLDFLTGRQKRAPEWMSRSGLEWLYRLASNPKRLWRRYLLHSPRVFWIFVKTSLFR